MAAKDTTSPQRGAEEEATEIMDVADEHDLHGAVIGACPECSTDSTGPSGANGLNVIATIRSSTSNGLIVEPLTFGTTGFVGEWYLGVDSGQFAIYFDQIMDPPQEYLFGQSYFKLYDSCNGGAWGTTDLSTTVVDDTADPAEFTIGYTFQEAAALRELFGQPNNLPTSNIIENAIASLSSFRQDDINTRFKSNAVKTQAFTDADLTILTDEEAAQGISLSMSSALTRANEAEAEAEGEAEVL
jgi:hypothetical protein